MQSPQALRLLAMPSVAQREPLLVKGERRQPELMAPLLLVLPQAWLPSLLLVEPLAVLAPVAARIPQRPLAWLAELCLELLEPSPRPLPSTISASTAAAQLKLLTKLAPSVLLAPTLIEALLRSLW